MQPLSVAGLRSVLGGRFGRGWVVEEAALVGVLVVVAVPRLRGRNRAFDVVVAGLVLAATLAQTVTSHLAASAGGSTLTMAAAPVHELAAMTWVGTLAAIVACGPALVRDRALATQVLARFGWLAVPCVAALIVTGLLLTGHQVVTVDALLFTHYGRILLLKVLLAAVAGALGLRHALTVRRKPGATAGVALPRTRSGLRRSIAAETATALLALALAAALSNARPARGPDYTPVPDAVPLPLNEQVADLLIGVSVRPDRPGPNFVSVVVRNTRIPAPAAVEHVTVRYRAQGPGALEAVHEAVSTGDSTWTDTSGILDHPGDWQLHIVVQRAGLPDAALDATWQVLPPQPPFTRQVRVSSATLAPTLDAAALAFGSASGVAYAFAVWRVRRRRRFDDAVNVSDDVADRPLSASGARGE